MLMAHTGALIFPNQEVSVIWPSWLTGRYKPIIYLSIYPNQDSSGNKNKKRMKGKNKKQQENKAEESLSREMFVRKLYSIRMKTHKRLKYELFLFG